MSSTTAPRLFSSASSLLEHLSGGGDLAAADLEIVLKKFASESQWHDFKSGRIAEDAQPKPGRRLRELLASFANSEGGVVFVGVATKGSGAQRQLVIDGYQ